MFTPAFSLPLPLPPPLPLQLQMVLLLQRLLLLSNSAVQADFCSAPGSLRFNMRFGCKLALVTAFINAKLFRVLITTRLVPVFSLTISEFSYGISDKALGPVKLRLPVTSVSSETSWEKYNK